MSFRFLHTADLHLDSPFKGMSSLPMEIRNKVIHTTFQALQHVIDLAISEAVDFVLFSGDVFDLADRSLRAQISFQQAMKELDRHHIEAFVIHGNHDPMDGHKASLSWPDNVHFFSDNVQTVPAHNRQGQQVALVHGISYRTAAVKENLALQFQAGAPSTYHIGMLHCNVDGDAEHEHYAPCSKQDLLRSGMDYWALGHIHTSKVVHANPYIIYPGNTQGRNIRETGEKGCYIVDVNEQGQTKLNFHNTDVLRWFNSTLEIEDIQTEQELIDHIEDYIESVSTQLHSRSAIIRLNLKGRGPLHRWLNREENVQDLLNLARNQQLSKLKQHPHNPFIWLESIRVQTGLPVDVEQLMLEESFLSDVLLISKELKQHNQELAQIAEEVFAPLLQHALVGKYVRQLEGEDLQQWMKAAEELAIDLLVEDGE